MHCLELWHQAAWGFKGVILMHPHFVSLDKLLL